MIGGDAQLMPAAWTTAELQWYADFVAQCRGQSRDPPDTAAVFELDAEPPEQCLLMFGDDDLDGRFEDSSSQLWSQDLHGRWFAKVDQKMVWLQCKLAQLRYRRAPRRASKKSGLKRDHSEVVSHLCTTATAYACSTSDTNPRAMICATKPTIATIPVLSVRTSLQSSHPNLSKPAPTLPTLQRARLRRD